MSRIHEALQKAAKERSEQLEGGDSRDRSAALVKIQSQARTEASIANRVEQQRVSAGGNQAGPFRYEELVKRCSHSKWDLDVRPNVFQGSGARNGGGDGFGKLRSRLYPIAGTRTLRRLLITSR